MIHDRECIGCQHLFECAGKPENVEQCIKLKERGEREGNGENRTTKQQ